MLFEYLLANSERVIIEGHDILTEQRKDVTLYYNNKKGDDTFHKVYAEFPNGEKYPVTKRTEVFAHNVVTHVQRISQAGGKVGNTKYTITFK